MCESIAESPAWQYLHASAIVWLLHDHYYHRLDANLAMREGGVTAKTVMPVADVAIYNDSRNEDDWEFYVSSLAQTEGWARDSLVRLERARRLYESRPDRFLVAQKAQDVLRAKREGKSAIFFGFEGCKALEGRIELLQVFHRLGVRHMQLTWDRPNQLVDASSGEWRLSGFGREALAGMNELGIVVDVSHAPWSFFAEVIEFSRQPVVVAHGAPSEAHPGWGDMERRHLDALKGCGGLLGLHFCRHYINGPFATFSDFLDTVDHLVERGYEDIIALGGDLFEDDAYFRRRHPAPADASHQEWRPFIDELSDISRLPNVTCGLVSRGYPQAVIRKLLGENALRVYRQALGG
ncbi:MAG TPA: membrane dipeptidase [Armatimonadota bacterium]|nr:membrane dipeptidase [Armatimonadota bacterium]